MAKYLNLAGLQTLWAKAKGAFAPKTHTHNFTEVQEPIAEKTYTGLIASSNTNGNGADFIMIDLAHVSDTSKIFKLRVRIEASYTRSNDNVTYASTHDCLIYGAGGNGTICYAMWNNHRNTSYRPMYYFVAYRPSTATANWKLGVSLYNCNNNTTAGNERTITMKIISQENCSATLYDSCANTDYTTYYKNMAGRTTYDCANNGLQESGDANTTTNVHAKEISGYSGTAAGTAAKAIDFAQFVYTGSRVFKAYIANANTANTPTINVNGQGAKTLYLLTADNTWTAASSTVKTITAGSHWFFWNGTYMYMLPDACNSSAIPTDVAYINGQAAYATKNIFVNGAFLVKGTHFRLRVDAVNTNTGDLSLNVNCQGAKPLFIDGVRANGTNKNMVVSWYEVVYDGTNYNAYSAAGGGIVYPEASHADTASAAKSGSALETAINGKANAASVTGATKCKVTYNGQGVITAGADLAASDIPNLDASKITSGTFADARIASASKWNGKQDALTAQTAYSAKGSATKVPKITTNALGQVTDITEVDIDQPDVSGKLNIDASNATSGTANGIFSHSPERPSSESYDVGDNDVLLVQDVGGDSTRRTTVSRLMKKFNGYLVDLGKRITEEVTSLNESIGTKISKTDIVQNLSAQNEDKVPSQKAVRYTTDLKLNISGSNATAEGTTAILSTLTEVDDKADDYDYYIFGNDDDHTNMHRKPMSKLWDYIKDKIDAVGDILRIQPKDIGGSGVLNKSFIGGVRQIALDSSDTSNNISSIYSASTLSQYRSYYGVIVIINTGTSSRSVTGFYGGKTATVPANQCIYCARHRIGTTDAFFLGY